VSDDSKHADRYEALSAITGRTRRNLAYLREATHSDTHLPMSEILGAMRLGSDDFWRKFGFELRPIRKPRGKR